MHPIILLILLVWVKGPVEAFWGFCRNTDPSKITCACPFGGLEVKGCDGVTVGDENCNSMQNRNEFKKMPRVTMRDADCSKVYTLFMLDPDVPDYPPGNFYNHLIVSNIGGANLKEGGLENANAPLGYRGPDPPHSTGVHRYMFLVYEQAKSKCTLLKVPEENRGNWSLATYLKEQPVKLWGPVAGTQFRTKT